MRAAEVLAVDVENLVRADVGAALRRLVNLRTEGGYAIAASIWEHVQDNTVFEEEHRFDAGLALVTLASTPEEQADAFDLLATHMSSVDDNWLWSYLRILYKLGTNQAVNSTQNIAKSLLGEYRMDPLLASYYLAYGIRQVGNDDTLEIIEDLFSYPELERYHDLVVRNLDSFQPEDPDDIHRVVRLLEKIQANSSLVRAIFRAELALYDRGHF
jgi:hypothetical protein